MSGRRRASDRQTESSREVQADKAAELDEQSLLGNQAISARMQGDSSSSDALETARDAALPMVERAGLALQIAPPDAGRLDRFSELVTASALGADRRAAILDRLQTDELVANDVSSAVVAVFGADGPDVRMAIDRVLESVGQGLASGSAQDGAFRLATGASVDLPAGGSRSNALISAVGDAVSSSSSANVSGAQILAFCQRVQLALLLDEEEEPVGPDYGVEETAG